MLRFTILDAFYLGFSAFVKTFWLARYQPTQEACYKILQDIAESCPLPKAKEFVNYMMSIKNWATFIINEKNGCANLHMLRSDNIVESTFSWIQDLRHHNPYVFTTMLLEKITVTNNLLREKVEKYKEKLTEVATKDCNTERQLAANFTENVVIINKDEGKCIVRSNIDSANVLPINIDLCAKTCSCTRWVQLGVPCRHAIACLQHFSNGTLNETNCYEWTLASTWKKLYKTATLYMHLPDAVGVARAKDKMLKDDDSTTRRAVVLRAAQVRASQVDASKKVNKRIKSVGEIGPSAKKAKLASGISGKKLKTCALCGKVTAIRTAHVCKFLKNDPLSTRCLRHLSLLWH
jgi:hypothetical protein